ncbi:MAG TPA: isocitrate lyase/phosphoenolpyruvate mutase family protein [Candidatus Eisenbacteria bacterium]|jgi:2-methylisocitrate lyase-like PEP mutase family enzyme|nr:isocitrate lyase/phosphoenolpyruvate mutase family protein [Candidatus Eisenbacteria bacterium]
MNDRQKRARLRELLAGPNGIIAPGVTDALFARLAQDCGYSAVHLSGNAIHKNFCLPDRNLLSVTQIAQRTAQIVEATEIPLIVDGGSACIEMKALARAVKLYERGGAAALRFEDALLNEYGAPAESLAIAPPQLMIERIKAAANARTDETLVLIARCDSRPKESLNQVQERLAAYVEAGADAVGVQLNDIEEFRRIAATAPAPLVSMWPRARMSAFEFIKMGYRIALMPSSVPMAAITAARELLLELTRSGRDQDYFARQREFADSESWYKNLGAIPE